MKSYYQVRTGWDLAISKKCFDCVCKMEGYVKGLLKKCDDFTMEQKLRSINVIKMDCEKEEEFRNIFHGK